MKKNQGVAKKLFTAKELSFFLNLSIQSIHRYTRQGVIPVVAIGRQRRFDPDQVLAALEKDREQKNGRGD